MAGTKQFITGSVGVGGRNASVDVRALQQLLIAAGTDVIGGADGGWGNNTRDAIQSALGALTPALDKAYVEREQDRVPEGRRGGWGQPLCLWRARSARLRRANGIEAVSRGPGRDGLHHLRESPDVRIPL